MSFWQRWSSKGKKIPLWMVGLGIGVIFWLVGFCEGQLEEMYRKAVMICLECIGIG